MLLKPQPDLPKGDGILPIRVGSVQGPQAGSVDSYDLISFTPRQGETFATLSRQVYGSEAYADAVRAYLQDYDPRLANLRPGQALSLPPAEVLQRRFSQRVPQMAPGGPSPAARRDVAAVGQPTSGKSVRSAPAAPPAREQLIPNADSARQQADARWTQPSDGKAGDKRYSVRQNDTLYLIAKKTLGNGDRWADIYNLNKDLLRGGVEVEVGMVLRLPAEAKVEAP